MPLSRRPLPDAPAIRRQPRLISATRSVSRAGDAPLSRADAISHDGDERRFGSAGSVAALRGFQAMAMAPISRRWRFRRGDDYAGFLPADYSAWPCRDFRRRLFGIMIPAFAIAVLRWLPKRRRGRLVRYRAIFLMMIRPRRSYREFADLCPLFTMLMPD